MVDPEGRSKWITHRWPNNFTRSEQIRVLQEAAGSLPFHSRYVAGE
jgi:hypothetical protein